MVTWDGGGADNKWHTLENWAGDRLPGEDNIAVFDATNSKDIYIDQPITVRGVEVIEGYTGTLTQLPGSTINVGIAGWHQYTGSFRGGGDTLDILGAYALVGGQFQAPASTMAVAGNFTVFGGDFDPNGGSVVLDGIEQVLFGDITFHHFTKDAGVAQVLELQAGRTITVTGDLKLSGAQQEVLRLRSTEPGTAVTLAARGGVTTQYLITEDVIADGWQLPPDSIPGTTHILAAVALDEEKTDFAAHEEPRFTLNIETNQIVIEPPAPAAAETTMPSPEPTTPPTPAPTVSSTPSPPAAPAITSTPAPAPTPTVSPDASPAPAPPEGVAAPSAAPTSAPPAASASPLPSPEIGFTEAYTAPSSTGGGEVSPTLWQKIKQLLSRRTVPEARAATEPSPAPIPSDSPEPTGSPAASSVQGTTAPEISPSPAFSPTPEPTPSPASAVSPEPSPTPSPIATPTAGPTPSPTASPEADATPPQLAFMLINPNRHPFPIEPELTINDQGKTTVTVPADILAREGPGAYTLTVSAAQGGETVTSSQDFTWGVLAMNFDRSTYEPGQSAAIGIGVLDNFGHTLCDARLTLTITDPSGGITNLTTDNGSIEPSLECGTTIVTDQPDYATSYQPEKIGRYEVLLEADTKNGRRQMEAAFEATTTAPYITSRASATRIYPWEAYPVEITLTARQPFNGEIIETVPASFEVSNIEVRDSNGLKIASPAGLSAEALAKAEASGEGSENWTLKIEEEAGRKKLIWGDAFMQAGDMVTLSYTYDAPNESPQFYLAGPLELFSPYEGEVPSGSEAEGFRGKAVWAEPRAWQIAADATMDQPIIGGTSDDLSTTATEYVRINDNGQTWNATIDRSAAAVPANVSGSFKTLKVFLSAAPDNGIGTQSYTFTLMIDEVASALSCTIEETAKDCTDTDEVPVTEKQQLNLRSAPSASAPVLADASWSVMWEGTNAILTGGTPGNLTTTGTEYMNFSGGDSSGSGTRANRTQLNATAGTLQNLYVASNTNPSPGSYQFNVIVDGTASGITCTISSGTTNCEDATNTKALTGGEEISLEIVASTPTAPTASADTWWAIEFVPTTSGESPFWSGNSGDAPLNTATEYNFVSGGELFSATEASFYQLNQVFTARDLRVKAISAPGAGKSFTITLRTTDGGDSLLACAVSDTNTTCSDTADDISITDADNRLSLSFAPSGTPTTNDYYYGMTSFIAPATSRTRVMIIGRAPPRPQDAADS